MTKWILLFMCNFLALAVAAVFSNPAFASYGGSSSNSDNVFYLGLNAAPVVSYANDSLNRLGGTLPGQGTVATSSTLGYDSRLTFGPIFYKFFLFGFSFNYKADETHRPSSGPSGSGDTTKNEHVIQKEWGPTWGLLYGHWQFMATWIISSQLLDSDSEANYDGSVAANTVTKNYDGRGWEFSLGYAFDIFDHFSLGASIVYRRVQYGMQSYTDNITAGNSYGGRAFADQAEGGEISPMLLISTKF